MGLTELRKQGADLGRLKTDKMRRFVLEYLLLRAQGKDSPKQAAINAGYPVKSAAQYANKLLKNPVIKAYIGKLERQDVERLELDRHEVLRQLYYAMTRRIKDFTNEDGTPKLPHELPPECQSIVDSYKAKILYTLEDGSQVMEVEYRVTPHAVAREQAMKHKGLFAPELLNLNVSSQQQFLDVISEPLPPDEIEQRLLIEEKKPKLNSLTKLPTR